MKAESRKKHYNRPPAYDEADIDDIVGEANSLSIFVILKALISHYGLEKIQDCLDAIANPDQ